MELKDKEKNHNLMDEVKDVLSSFNFGFIIDKFKEEEKKKKAIKSTYEILSHAATPSKEFYILMLLSSIIATAGLIQGSSATVIGAMLVAPLMTPILAFSLGVVWGDFKLMGRAMWSIIRGIGIALGVASFIAFLTPFTHYSKEIMMRTTPRLFDIIVALASGFVGGYAYANRKIFSALPGVAISVALLPPLSVVGIGIAKLKFNMVMGASLLFLINLLAILMSSSLVFLIMKVHPRKEEEEATRRATIQILFTGFLLFAIALPVSYFTYRDIKISRIKQNMDKKIREVFPFDTISESNVVEKNGRIFYSVTLLSGHLPEKEEINKVKRVIKQEHKNIVVEINFIEEMKF